MEQFLLQYKNAITFGVEFLAAITGIILYRKYKFTIGRYFIYFLIYLTICDTFGSYTLHIRNGGIFSFLEGTVFIRNYWWFTLCWKIGAIMFFSFYFQKILTNNAFKQILKYTTYAFFVFSMSYIVINWSDFFVRFFPAISVFGAIIVFMCSVFYFIEILKSDKILTFYNSLNFYISTGIFVWWLIITPLVFYDIYMTNRDWNFIFLRWQIYLFANIFMYSTFTFALIWCKPEKN